jgi:hypothetical protein
MVYVRAAAHEVQVRRGHQNAVSSLGVCLRCPAWARRQRIVGLWRRFSLEQD